MQGLQTKVTDFKGNMHAKGDCCRLWCAQVVLPNSMSWHVCEHAGVGASGFLQISTRYLVFQMPLFLGCPSDTHCTLPAQVQDLEAQLKQVLSHQSKPTEHTPLKSTVV